MDFRDPGSEGRSAVHFRSAGSEGGVQWTLGTPLGFELANSRSELGGAASLSLDHSGRQNFHFVVRARRRRARHATFLGEGDSLRLEFLLTFLYNCREFWDSLGARNRVVGPEFP